jgi:hypothetical protein
LTSFASEPASSPRSRGGAEQGQESTAFDVGGVIVEGCEDAHGYRDRRIEIPKIFVE